jgi:hypothetical protein
METPGAPPEELPGTETEEEDNGNGNDEGGEEGGFEPSQGESELGSQ